MTEILAESRIPDSRVVGAEGFLPLTVVVDIDPLQTTTVYVRAEMISGVYLPPALTALEADLGAPSPGSNLSLVGEAAPFSVLENPREVFDLIQRAMVLKAR